MNTIEIDLNYYILNHEHIKTNKHKSVFLNTKSNRRLKVVRNCRSYGIWVDRKFLPLSKIKVTQTIGLSSYSKELSRLLTKL